MIINSETTNALVPVVNLDALKDKIAKLNRRAKRLGCTPITLTVGAKVIAEKTQTTIPDYSQGGVPTSRTIKVECVPVNVTGESPVLPGGWNLVARIQLVQGDDGVVSLAHLVPGETIPAHYHSASNHCDHCNMNRTRNDVFVVRDNAGMHMQVGRSCITAFLGEKFSPSQLALIAECLAALDLREFESYDGEGGGRGRTMLDVERYLTVTAAVIRTFGWVSRKAAKEDYSGRTIATADIAGEAYWNASKAEVTITDADNAMALAAIDWATSQDASGSANAGNDYMINAQKVANLSYIPVNLTGIAASIVSSYQRDLGRKATAAASAPSSWQGTVGDRFTATLTVERTHSFQTNYGTTTIHNFKDAAGNVFVWFASKEKLNTGATYTVTGTVKKHSDYRGTKQTELARCKAVAVKQAA